MDNKIQQLRTFFRVTNAVFDFKNSIQSIFNPSVTHNNMQILHRIALVEIEKENPNMELIDKLLQEMENLAEINNNLTKKN